MNDVKLKNVKFSLGLNVLTLSNSAEIWDFSPMNHTYTQKENESMIQ